MIADCNLDKDYAARCTNGTKRNPGRDKALALCIAAGMKKSNQQSDETAEGISAVFQKQRKYRIAAAYQ